MPDTVTVGIISDTLRVINVARPFLSPELLVIIAAVVGGVIGFTGQFLLQRRQTRFETRKLYLVRVLDAYMRLAEIVSGGLILAVDMQESIDPFLRPYNSFPDLQRWMQSLADHISKNALLFEKETRDKAIYLVANLGGDLQDIQNASLASPGNDKGAITRGVGRKRLREINDLSEELLASANGHLKREFHVGGS